MRAVRFLEGFDLVFRSKLKDKRHGRTETNGTVFLEWVEKQLIPVLPEKKSLLVMDYAPYHNIIEKESIAPTSNSPNIICRTG